MRGVIPRTLPTARLPRADDPERFDIVLLPVRRTDEALLLSRDAPRAGFRTKRTRTPRRASMSIKLSVLNESIRPRSNTRRSDVQQLGGLDLGQRSRGECSLELQQQVGTHQLVRRFFRGESEVCPRRPVRGLQQPPVRSKRFDRTR
jgi:hypothetical protein